MSKIFITGDTHGGYKSGGSKLIEFAKTHKNLCKDDFLIVAGDFGFIWENEPDGLEIERFEWFEKQKFTTLFIDGNHENFNRLNSYEISEFKGGKVHKISPSVFHLMRSQIYDFDGLKIFTLGGAMSVDKYRRQENISWWSGENITQDDINEAWANLRKADFSVDVVVTHTCPRKFSKNLINFRNYDKVKDINMDILQGIYENIKFKKWYFGHFHKNAKIGAKFHCLYDEITQIRTKPSRSIAEKFEKINENELPKDIQISIKNLLKCKKSDTTNLNLYETDLLYTINSAKYRGEITGEFADLLRQKYLGSSEKSDLIDESKLPIAIQKDIKAWVENGGFRGNLRDVLWGELYGSINGSQHGGEISKEVADYLRQKYLGI